MLRRLACLVVLAGLATGPVAGAAEPAESVSLATPDGRALQLAVGPDAPPLLLHFWASWCAECAVELPVVDAALASCAGTPVRAYLVNVGESAGTARAFAGARGVTDRLALDAHGEVWRRFVPSGLPANAIFVAGRVERSMGPLDPPGWQKRLAALGCAAAATRDTTP